MSQKKINKYFNVLVKNLLTFKNKHIIKIVNTEFTSEFTEDFTFNINTTIKTFDEDINVSNAKDCVEKFINKFVQLSWNYELTYSCESMLNKLGRQDGRQNVYYYRDVYILTLTK